MKTPLEENHSKYGLTTPVENSYPVIGYKELGVEEAIIRAINEVEASGKGFIKLNGRMLPKINFERHYFHKITKGKFTASNPDISWKQGYYQKGVKYIPCVFTYVDDTGKTVTFNSWRNYTKKDKAKKDKVLDSKIRTGKDLYKQGIFINERDAYQLAAGTYKRLAKAYALNKEAALRSSSWGAFQIMGEHYKTMKYASVTEFVKSMSRSEREHIQAFVKYCKHVRPEIIKAMKNKNFIKIAIAFNGESYANNKYDELLAKSYKKWSKK